MYDSATLWLRASLCINNLKLHLTAAVAFFVFCKVVVHELMPASGRGGKFSSSIHHYVGLGII